MAKNQEAALKTWASDVKSILAECEVPVIVQALLAEAGLTKALSDTPTTNTALRAFSLISFMEILDQGDSVSLAVIHLGGLHLLRYRCPCIFG